MYNLKSCSVHLHLEWTSSLLCYDICGSFMNSRFYNSRLIFNRVKLTFHNWLSIVETWLFFVTFIWWTIIPKCYTWLNILSCFFFTFFTLSKAWHLPVVQYISNFGSRQSCIASKSHLILILIVDISFCFVSKKYTVYYNVPQP